MLLTELTLRDAYDTGGDSESVIEEFYVPVLSTAKSYKRLTGYFSSQVLALAARGIAGLIQNNGRMQLITSPVVSEKDFEVLTNFTDSSVCEFIDRQFDKAILDINDLATRIELDHVRALGWMLRERHLEIRVLIPSHLHSNAGIFHSKVGIVEDIEGNAISFSGSVNETAMGWSQNIEEFKVFKSWEESHKSWVMHDLNLFNKYWSTALNGEFKSVPLPKASLDKLISIAPENIDELNLVPFISKKPKLKSKKLRDYQVNAIDSWANSEFRGILEMATGTGKTFTASECILRWRQNKKDSITLVTVPTQTIGAQWSEALSHLNPVTTFGNKPWKQVVKELKTQSLLGITPHAVLIAIQNTASSIEFVEAVKDASLFTENRLILSDEVHGLGSPKFREALIPEFGSRLGLTATPQRWFDDEGSKLILDYFGGVVFKFGIDDALGWIDPETGLTPLCPYRYYPEFIELDSHEMEEYIELTRRIIVKSHGSNSQDDEIVKRLLEKRALILKNAEGKIHSLRKILKTLTSISDCLIYCSNRAQIEKVVEVVIERGLTYRTFTGDEGTSPRPEYQGLSERDWILQSFKSGHVQVLIAMKCLDEGVDIPSAQLGLILASSTNPREFIQRRGRLLRRNPGKKQADIYDFVVAPTVFASSNDEMAKSGVKIMEKEIARVEQFSQNALNLSEITSKIMARINKMGSQQ